MNQKDQVLSYLREHGSITSLEAINTFWITRLSQMILLLKKDGHKITGVTECNSKKHWTRYYLTEDKK